MSTLSRESLLIAVMYVKVGSYTESVIEPFEIHQVINGIGRREMVTFMTILLFYGLQD